MAGNNYTVPFAALVDGLDRNVLPAGHPLAFPAPKSSSVESVADDIASRTPVEIARRCKLYALPEEVWSLVDEGDLSLRKAEIIADLAAVEAPWTERVEEMIETARECVEEAWDRVTCREECGERKGRMAGDGEPSVHSQVAEAQDDAEEQVEETRERIEELTELAERLERGMEERFDGGLVGLDARRKYCYSCGQAVRKEDVEGVLERVRGMVGERSSDE